VLQKFSKQRIAAIGDGGNDVGMITASHVGLGIVGKEGMQASLASDFSLPEFKVIEELLLWHGRLSYKRTAKLGNFVFHRGLIISVIQVLFTSIFYFGAIPIYNGYLMLGYTTVYTMMPVFSLVLD
jgi:phospholipid-translocating ATPase